MTNCKPISIPLKQNVKLNADEGGLVGSLIYITITRLDLNYEIIVVS
jgi:hypothetical protein